MSFLQAFNQFKIIHCMCPHCDSIVRVSELQLRASEKAEKTWLDSYISKEKNIQKKGGNLWMKKEAHLREEAKERGRKMVPKIINKSMDKNFLKLRYNPYDVKAILHPIDFVAFRGMEQGDVTDVTLLSRKLSSPKLEKIHNAIADVVKKKSYDWKVLRVSQDGQVKYE